MIFFILTLIGALSQGSAGTRTVWDGVYTSTQLERGRQSFEANCSRCHGLDASGDPDARLSGERFMERWREDTIDVLFDQLKLTMPPNRSGNRTPLSDEIYLDLLGFIFARNEFPPGERELTVADLKTTLLIGREGPRPLPANTMVQIVGCLVRVQDVWMLTRATEPRRTRTPYESSPQELESDAASPLGTRNFRLQNIEELDAANNVAREEGHRMQAKGILNLQPGRERIAVTSVRSLGESCTP